MADPLARMFLVSEEAFHDGNRLFKVLHGGMDYIRLKWRGDGQWFVKDEHGRWVAL